MNLSCQYKKSASLVFSVILAFVLFAVPFNNLSSAASGGGGGVLPAVTLSILSQPAVAVDSDFIASVKISQVTNFDAVDYTLLFDPAVLRLDDITPGTIGSTSVPVMYNQTGYGRYIIVQNIPGLAGVNGSGSLAILHFHVLGILGTSSSIFLSNATISNTSANESYPLLVGDHVDVNIIAGDANQDGKVDSVDITKIERIIARLDDATPGADANQDGKYDSLDINEIKRIIAGLSHSSLAPAAALAETKVPDLNLDLYLYVKQANPTVVPADLVGSTTDIDLDSLALWGIVENNDYSIAGAINFCDAADALTGYSLIPAETGLWTMLSGRTIYAVYGSGTPFERLKSAIINNNFKKYDDAQALNEVAALPYNLANKPIMIGVLNPRPEVIKLIENHIDSGFSRTIDNLTPWAQPQILTLGLYSSQPVSVADVQNRLDHGTLWDLNFGVLASVISAGPASVFSATAEKYLSDNDYEKIKLENVTVYRDCVKYIADTTLPALINVNGKHVFEAVATSEDYAATLITGIRTPGCQFTIEAPAQVSAGDNFTATLKIENVTGLDAANFDIKFDPAILKLNQLSSGLIGNTSVPVDVMNQIDQGVFSVAFNVPGLNGASGSGYLAKLDFQAAGHQGQSSSISISNLTIAGTQAEKIPASGIGDSISITIPVNNASPGNSGGGNSGGVSSPPTNKVVISGLKSTSDVNLDASGRAISANILKTTDDKVRFEIGKNTLLLNSQGALLSNLSVSVLTSPPQPPPQNVILLAYEFGPQGAVFNPPLNLTLTFNPDTFAQPLDETMLRLAYWSGSDWVTLESQIDITTGTIHTQISHFSQYALLGRVIPKTTELAETTPLIPSTVPAFSPSRTEIPAPTSQVVGIAEIPSGEVVENRKVEPPPVAETTPLQTPAAKSNSPLTWLIIGGLLIIITALGILLIRKNKP